MKRWLIASSPFFALSLLYILLDISWWKAMILTAGTLIAGDIYSAKRK